MAFLKRKLSKILESQVHSRVVGKALPWSKNFSTVGRHVHCHLKYFSDLITFSRRVTFRGPMKIFLFLYFVFSLPWGDCSFLACRGRLGLVEVSRCDASLGIPLLSVRPHSFERQGWTAVFPKFRKEFPFHFCHCLVFFRQSSIHVCIVKEWGARCGNTKIRRKNAEILVMRAKTRELKNKRNTLYSDR